jgi:hypothetical protein
VVSRRRKVVNRNRIEDAEYKAVGSNKFTEAMVYIPFLLPSPYLT